MKEIVIKFCLLILISNCVGLTFPDFPNQFSASIDFTITEKSYTGTLWEYYDTANNRFRLDRYVGGSYSTRIYLPVTSNTGIAYLIGNGACSVSQFNGTVNSQILTTIPNSRQFIKPGNPYNATYVGVANVRNVDTDLWYAEYLNITSGYTVSISYYFGIDNWNIIGSSSVKNAPVRIVVNGTSGSGQFNHIYDYFQFITDPIPNSFFEINPSLKCGYITNPPIPQVNSTFKAKIEKTDFINNFTTYYDWWYDGVNGLIRYEFSNGPSNQVKIANLKENSLYIMEGSNCYVQSYYTDATNFSVLPLLAYSNKQNTKYQGITSVRSIPAQLWIVNIVLPSATYNFEVYFSVSTPSIPLRIKTVGNLYMSDTDTWQPLNFQIEYLGLTDVKSYDNVLFQIPFGYDCGNLVTKSIPQLPNQWRATIQFNDKYRQLTTTYAYYFDYTNNNLRTTEWSGLSYTDVYYSFSDRYKLVHTYIASIGDDNCEKKSLLQSEYNDFTKNTGRLLSSNSYFNIQSSERYQGVRTVRGVQCDYWISDTFRYYYNGVYNDVKVHHYFAVQGWNMNLRTISDPVLMRVVYEGSYRSTTGAKTPFRLEIEIMNYFSGSNALSSSSFVPPSTSNCPSKYTSPFPTIPTVYKAIVQANKISDQKSFTYTVASNLDEDLRRIDYSDDNGLNYIQVVHGPSNLLYTVNLPSPIGNSNTTCSAVARNSTSVYKLPLEISDIIKLKPKDSFISYLGVFPSRRGIECDVWTYPLYIVSNNRTLTGKVFWYFNRATWSIHQSDLNRIPIRFEIFGNLTEFNQTNTVHDIYDIISFNIENNLLAFDVDPSWNCPKFSNPVVDELNTTIISLFEVGLTLEDFNSKENQFIYNISKYLNIKSSTLNILKLSRNFKKNPQTTFVYTNIDAAVSKKSDINSKLDYLNTNSSNMPIIYQSSSINAGCYGCKNGSCYFGKCWCYDGYTGENCEKEITVVSVSHKPMGDYFSGMILIFISMSMLGGLVGFAGFRYFYRLDFKIQMKLKEH